MKTSKVLAFILLTIIINGCGVRRSEPGNFKQLSQKKWQQEFKKNVLCNCVLLGMNDKNITQQFYKKDKSFYNEINIVLHDEILSVLSPVINQIKSDSIMSISTVSEGAAGKTVFNHCLDYYNSKKLDSISKVKSKMWLKMNVDSLMQVKAPAF
ncbi:hypothetical protein [Mucilaginibacter sp.]|uniref:hypothetical protein n=1 Tax=Mucilaginibacter sp. TaxID=1882438 RepID=UPI00261C4C79|nr:hypothetical protein [Mucilaginibacter sp.]